jgi:beta-N-acetylhexosaminidase
MPSLLKLAYSTLLPATSDLELSQPLISFLENGGRSILFAETGEEYATGVINPERSAFETAERWRSEIGRARSVFGPLLIALDADISAVHRLQYLTPPLPSLSEAQQMTSADLESRVQAMAAAARSLGVNLLLSPTADVVSGHNDWLTGRSELRSHQFRAWWTRTSGEW